MGGLQGKDWLFKIVPMQDSCPDIESGTAQQDANQGQMHTIVQTVQREVSERLGLIEASLHDQVNVVMGQVQNLSKRLLPSDNSCFENGKTGTEKDIDRLDAASEKAIAHRLPELQNEVRSLKAQMDVFASQPSQDDSRFRSTTGKERQYQH